MQLRVVQSTPKLILEWDPVPGAVAGYRGRASGVEKWTQTQQTRMTFAANATGVVVQALGVEDEGHHPPTQPPPTGQGGKHVAALRYNDYVREQEYVRGDYFVTAEWAAQQAAGDLPIPVFAYCSAITARDDWIQNISRSEAISRGFVLKTPEGASIEAMWFHPTVLCDMGNSAYQQRWIEFILAQYRDHDGVQGVFIDDVVQSPHICSDANNNPVVCALYRTQPEWRAGMEEFMSVVGPELKRNGLDVMPNTGAWYPSNPTYDTGASSADWAGTIAKWVTHCHIEYGFQNINENPGPIRRMGPEWFNNWDGWAEVIKAIEAAGANYAGMADAPSGDSPEAIYLKASMMLFMKRPGSACVFVCDKGAYPYAGQLIEADLGARIGDATLSGQVWTANFANGQVKVNPWTMWAQITASNAPALAPLGALRVSGALEAQVEQVEPTRKPTDEEIIKAIQGRKQDLLKTR